MGGHDLTVIFFLRLTSCRKINIRTMQNTAPSSNKAYCDAIGYKERGQRRMPQGIISMQVNQSITILSADRIPIDAVGGKPMVA